jgi:MtN3 and saliva related transmembrane protein
VYTVTPLTGGEASIGACALAVPRASITDPPRMKIELIGYLAALLTSVAFAPQALRTLRSRDTKSISAGTYALFTTGATCWLIYGLLIGSVPVVLANAVTLVLTALILFLKLRHG